MVGQVNPSRSSWQGSLRDLANIVNTIRRSRAFGRLTIRNIDRLGVAHLYFRSGKLVHMISNLGDANATLSDLKGWTRATIRFERSVHITSGTITEDQEQTFDSLLLQLQLKGIVNTPRTPRVVEGRLIASPQAAPLVSPHEWWLLVEGTRRVSLAVAHLIGPQEALAVLRDILDDCTSAFPAFSCLRIAATGYLQVSDTSQFNRIPRSEVIEGFAALIATCQYFCSPIIGEMEAHKLIIQALSDIGPALVNLGVFQIDNTFLSNSNW